MFWARLQDAAPLEQRPLEAQAGWARAVASSGVDARLPRPTIRGDGPQLIAVVNHPGAVPDHALAEGRDLVAVVCRRRVAHAGTGSSAGRVGSGPTGLAGGLSRSGSCTGWGSSSG